MVGMDILDAIESEAINIEMGLTKSLPICNKEKELIFLYSRKSGMGEYPMIGKLEYVYIYYRANNRLERIEISDLGNEKLTKDFVIKSERSSLTVGDVRNAVSAYHRAYPVLVKSMDAGNVSPEDGASIKEIINNYNTLVTSQDMKEIYKEFGAEMFEFLNNNN